MNHYVSDPFLQLYNNSSLPALLCVISYTVQMIDIMSKTGVPLDPVYTLKGVRGMLGEVTDNPTVFSGKRILYIHTGEFTHTLASYGGSSPHV